MRHHVETACVLAGVTATLARQFDLPRLAVEFGAGDGLKNTTTRYLIQRLEGWKGLWIEAHPETYSTLQQNIKKANLPVDAINVAISDHDGTAPFYCCTLRRRQGWSSLVAGDQRLHPQHKSVKYKKTKVECRRLLGILACRGEVDKVGVMVCDIEEHDTVVIADMIGNTRIRPVVLMVEGNTPEHQQQQARLLDADYRLVWNFTDGINRIYVRRGFLEMGARQTDAKIATYPADAEA